MKIGFIGLGIMGKPMAKNLLKAGYELNICDINEDAVADVAAAGGVPYKTAKETAACSDVILTMLPNSPQVKTVIEGNPDSEISKCFFDLAELLLKEEENA